MISYAIDTNILARSIQHSHPMQKAANNALELLRLEENNLCIFPQNLYEFWAIATRQLHENGLGLTATEAHAELIRLRSLFHLFMDIPAIFSEWERLAVQHGVAGKTTHDARIAAAMKVHGISHLLTFNVSHFRRFQAIVVVSPDEVIESARH